MSKIAPKMDYNRIDLGDGESLISYSIEYYNEICKVLGKIDAVRYKKGYSDEKHPIVRSGIDIIKLDVPENDEEAVKCGAILYLIGKARCKCTNIHIFDGRGNAIITTKHIKKRKPILQKTLDNLL